MDERPLDCAHCKRKATIVYRKLSNGQVDSCRMCSLCPILQSNIGIPVDNETPSSPDLNQDKKCPHCHTLLHDLTTGGSLGCCHCYATFEEFLVKELTESDAIPLKSDSFVMKEKSIPIHLGASPEIFRNDDAAKTLESLQSALTEALTFENYERAAYLRDQIKTLSEKLYGKEHKAS